MDHEYCAKEDFVPDKGRLTQLEKIRLRNGLMRLSLLCFGLIVATLLAVAL